MKNILKKFGLSFLALVFVLSVGIFANTKTASAATLTADMGFALTLPVVDANNTIAVVQTTGAKTVGAGVGNGINSVVITGTKLSTQTVAVGGTDMGLVAAAGTSATPTYTVNISSIAVAGGTKTFTLTVSETDIDPIVYNVTIQVAPFTAVNLRTAGDFAILSKTAITTTGVTSIVGDIGISPAAASYIEGFGLVPDSTACFSTTVPTTLVTGSVYASNYNTGSCTTPAKLTTAVSAMEAAYTDATTRTPGTGATNLNVGEGTLTGLNFVPGTYTWGSNVTITGDITFTGSATDVWIIQISGNLSIASGKKIILSGGAVPANIFWAVAGTTTLGTTSTFEGNILGGPGTSTIAMQNGAVLHGRALGQTNVSLIGNTIVVPGTSSDATLSNIDITPYVGTVVGTVSSLIAPILPNNTRNVLNSVTSVTVTPTVSEGTTIKVKGVTVASGVASASIPLSVGNNIITITTTAPDLTTLSYVINIRRAALSRGGSIPTNSPNKIPAPGCSAGNIYNTSTGALCVNNAAPQGCSGGNLFNTSTGAACINNVGNTNANLNSSTHSGPYALGIVTLKNGSKGEAVKELQRFLNAKLALGLVIDGSLGPKTIAVIKTWQKDNGLVSDGLVGAKTKAMMNK